MINTDQNQLPGDNSADIPSIIYRKAFTVTTSTSGSGYVEGTGTVTAPGIKIGDYNEFDLVVNFSGTFVTAPCRTATSAGANQYWAEIWLDSTSMTNSSSTATYNYRIRKYGGATTDSYTCYLILWSTKINKDLDLFTTAY